MNGAAKKIVEFNEPLNKISDPLHFEGLIKVLGSPQTYHSSSILVKQLECLREILTFPTEKVFPCIDLYRLFICHPQSNIEFTRSDMGAKEMAMMLDFLG